MYESHWQLIARPFEASNDARFYYPSEVHQGALFRLRYALENRRSAALIAGPSGLGKTILVQQLAAQLPEAAGPLVHLVFPQMPADQLLAYLAAELSTAMAFEPDNSSAERGFRGGSPSVEQSVRRLHGALVENARKGRHAILALDEAHLIRDPETLDTIRLLLNFQHQGRPVATLLLIGLPSLLTTLQRIPELEDRIDLKCLLPRFTLEQTMGYVAFRLKAAGATRTIFASDAVECLHDASQGVPRRINRLADLALLVGFAEELDMISARHVESVADELLARSIDAGAL
ncbi:MAG: ExeA family protein [Planctomycetota bacterium]